MKTSKELFIFSIRLLLALAITFAVHTIINISSGIDFTSNLIIESYSINYLLVLVTFAFMLFWQKKKNANISLIFMIGFLLKMIFFLLFFKPKYSIDGNIEGAEIAAFFLPYMICLSFETYRLVQILNKKS